jgi:hypothetical protein
MYNAKTSFLQFQASHFSIRNQSTNHVFSKPFLGPPFSHVFFDLFKNDRFCDPLQNQVGAKMAFEIDQWAPKGANKA